MQDGNHFIINIPGGIGLNNGQQKSVAEGTTSSFQYTNTESTVSDTVEKLQKSFRGKSRTYFLASPMIRITQNKTTCRFDF